MKKMKRGVWLALAFALAPAACVDAAPGLPSASMDAVAGAAGGAHAPDSGGSWCSARSVLVAKCQRCHGEPARHGAPFALLGYEDTQVSSSSGKPRYASIASAIESDFMPPSFLALDPPVLPLTDDERSSLLAWCEAGAPLDGDCAER